ncbi:hypothetical protein BDQ17DRAFT_1371444 [Cyathus striatus]|nr:hypothetical protein BDQ17DRAFT_1371444 [Cyathus striatus]
MNRTDMASTPQSNSPLQSTLTKDVFQSAVKGRKFWKTLGHGGAVWPPELEAALIEGFESYTPDYLREMQLLDRFPMKIRFVSDYIFDKTGRWRNANQIGRRLQELMNIRGRKNLLSLLSQISLFPTFTFSSLRDDGDSSSDGSTPGTPTDVHQSPKTFSTAKSIDQVALDHTENGISSKSSGLFEMLTSSKSTVHHLQILYRPKFHYRFHIDSNDAGISLKFVRSETQSITYHATGTGCKTALSFALYTRHMKNLTSAKSLALWGMILYSTVMHLMSL